LQTVLASTVATKRHIRVVPHLLVQVFHLGDAWCACVRVCAVAWRERAKQRDKTCMAPTPRTAKKALLQTFIRTSPCFK
jgi:hypothetical protein